MPINIFDDPNTAPVQAPPPEPAPQAGGWFQGALDTFNKPLTDYFDTTKQFVQELAQPESDDVGPGGELSTSGYLKAFLGGGIEGASKPSTIANAASLGTTGKLAAVMNIPSIIEGANTASDPSRSMTEKVLGGVQATAGLVGGGVSGYLGKRDVSPLGGIVQARRANPLNPGRRPGSILGLNQVGDAAQATPDLKVPTPGRPVETPAEEMVQGVDYPAPIYSQKRQREVRPKLPETADDLITPGQNAWGGMKVPRYEGNEGEKFFLERMRGKDDLSQGEQDYAAAMMARDPKGAVGTAIYGQEGQPHPSSLTDFMKAEDEARGIRLGKEQELKSEQNLLEKQFKLADRAADSRFKAHQDLDKLNEADDLEAGKFLEETKKDFGKRSAEEASNLNAKEAYGASLAEEMDEAIDAENAAQKAGELADGLVQSGVKATQRFKVKTPDGGEEVVTVTFGAPKAEKGSGGGGGQAPKAGPKTPETPKDSSSVIMDLNEALTGAKTEPEVPTTQAAAPIAATKVKGDKKAKVDLGKQFGPRNPVENVVGVHGPAIAPIAPVPPPTKVFKTVKQAQTAAKKAGLGDEAVVPVKGGFVVRPKVEEGLNEPAAPPVETPAQAPARGKADIPLTDVEPGSGEAATAALKARLRKQNGGGQPDQIATERPVDPKLETPPIDRRGEGRIRTPEEDAKWKLEREGFTPVNDTPPQSGQQAAKTEVPAKPAQPQPNVNQKAADWKAQLKRTPDEVADQHYKSLQAEQKSSGQKMTREERSNDAIVTNLSNAPIDQGRGIAGIAAGRLAKEQQFAKQAAQLKNDINDPSLTPGVKTVMQEAIDILERQGKGEKVPTTPDTPVTPKSSGIVDLTKRNPVDEAADTRVAAVKEKIAQTETPKPKAAAAPIAPVKAKGTKEIPVDTGKQFGPKKEPIKGMMGRMVKENIEVLTKKEAAAATTTPAKAGTPAIAPAAAAKEVTKHITETVDMKGATTAKDVHDRVIKALEDKLALVDDSKNPPITWQAGKAYGGREGSVFQGEEVIAHIDKNGTVRPAYGVDDAIKDALPKHLSDVRDATAGRMAQAARSQITQALQGKKGSAPNRFTVEIPGDGTFTIENNSVAIQEVIDRVQRTGPKAWTDIAEVKPKAKTPISMRGKKNPFEARRVELAQAEKASGEPAIGSKRWQEAKAKEAPEVDAEIKKVADDFNSEKGFALVDQQIRLATGAAGAAAGGAAGAADADESKGESKIMHAIVGAVLGGTVGALSPEIAQGFAKPLQTAQKVKDGLKTAVQIFPDYRRGALLFNMPNLIINSVVGPYGSAIMGALEAATAGDKRGMVALAKLANPYNFGKKYVTTGWREAGALNELAAGRGEMSTALANSPRPVRSLISAPGRFLTAGDIAAKEILMSSGFSAEQAQAITLTDEPSHYWAQSLANIKRGPGAKSWGMQVAFPFVRTVLNQVEGSLERTPGVGTLFQKIRSIPPDPKNFQRAQQILGGGVLLGSATLGMMMPRDPAYSVITAKVLSNLTGQYGTLAVAAFAAGQAAQGGETDAFTKFVNTVAYQVPLPTTQAVTDMGKLGKKVMSGEFQPGKDLPNYVLPQALKPETTEKMDKWIKSTVGMEEEKKPGRMNILNRGKKTPRSSGQGVSRSTRPTTNYNVMNRRKKATQ